MELTTQVEVLLPSKESSISHTSKLICLKQDATRVALQLNVMCRDATSWVLSNYGIIKAQTIQTVSMN